MLKRLSNFLKSKLDKPMKKKSQRIHVRATKDGKLYINVSELFKQKNVQALVKKMASSEAFKPEGA